MIKTITFRLIRLVLSFIGKENRSLLYSYLHNSHRDVAQENFRKKYSIDKTFRFNGNSVSLYGEGTIICNANSYIGNLSTIQSTEGYSVEIGRGCQISHNVRIYTSTLMSDQPFDDSKKVRNGNVIIEDYVWIGANVFIGPGVTIGKNAVVGANSVVTRDIPPNTIWGGVPVKLIKEKTIKI